jgi:hypothetical protein
VKVEGCCDYSFLCFQSEQTSQVQFSSALRTPVLHAGALRTTTRTSPTPRRRTITSKYSSYTLLNNEPPLRSSGQSSWLQIQRSGFDSRRYQIFCEVVSLERGPLRLVSTIEELFGRKSSGSGLEIREYGHGVSVVLTMRHPLSAKVRTIAIKIVCFKYKNRLMEDVQNRDSYRITNFGRGSHLTTARITTYGT